MLLCLRNLSSARRLLTFRLLDARIFRARPAGRSVRGAAVRGGPFRFPAAEGRARYAGLARYGVRNLRRGAHVMQRGLVMRCPLVVPRGIVAPSFAQNGEFAACSLEAEGSRAARTSRADRVAAACGLRAGCSKPERWDAGLLLGFPNDEGRSLWTGIGLERFATCLRRYAWA